ncbi:MAG: ethanolamine ammonia-lyase reactivating factor EutA [Muricomes sp.]
MKQAIIDIGSNSMRLTLYEIDGTSFRILFKEKFMAGLARYVESDILSAEGIERAYTGLLNFRETLEALDIKNVAVFATASLRNIKNTEEALTAIKIATGYSVEIISGESEALLGYTGAMQEISLADGAFIDIGGGSTEIVSFENGQPLSSASFHVGSLNLYRECVKKIMPGNGSLKRIQKTLTNEIDKKSLFTFDKRSPLICVGGTARAVLKIAGKLYDLPPGCRTVSKAQFNDMCALLCKGNRAAADIVLKLEPDRIHTIVPGLMIMKHIFQLFNSDKIIVSKYSVREGYLCQKLLQTNKTDICIPKIES